MIELSLKYCKFWHTKCIWAPKMMCTHCQDSTEWMSLPRTQGGAWDSQFICICLTGANTIGGNKSKVCFMVHILHGKPIEKVYKSTESLKKVIHILGDVIHALETPKCLLMWYQWKTIVRLQHAWLVWSLSESNCYWVQLLKSVYRRKTLRWGKWSIQCGG